MIANICWAPFTHERGRLCARAGCSSQKWKQFFLHVKIFTHTCHKKFLWSSCFDASQLSRLHAWLCSEGMFSVIYFIDAIGKELGVHLKPISFLNLRRRVSDFPEDFPFNLNWALCEPVERAPRWGLEENESPSTIENSIATVSKTIEYRQFSHVARRIYRCFEWRAILSHKIIICLVFTKSVGGRIWCCNANRNRFIGFEC